MQPLPRIPGYVLLKSLGGGPLTAVFAASENATDAPCAVKVLRTGLEDLDNVGDPTTAIKLFQREARAGLAVRHPHLVRFRHAHVTRAPYFLVMDLVPGESLQKRLRRDYRIDLASALWIARQTAEAITALHRAGFVHGDVKPDNIRLTNQGTATLIDLGFAHRPGENRYLLDKGYVLGTVNYLAPELCDKKYEDGLASDLFSFGVTLYEMLSGSLPYAAGTVEQTFRRHCFDPPADIRRHVAGLPRALIDLIEALLARRPEDRPRAGAVVRQLVELEIATLQRRRTA
jgi:serine/threonine protein kinase